MPAMKICRKCNGQFEEGIAYCPKDGARLVSLSKMATAAGGLPRGAGQTDAEGAASVAAEDTEADLTGRTIAQRYEVLRRLGEGGMGVVYEAVDNRLEKRVAIKVLREDFARRSDVVARFTQEAKSVARIKHENVLDVTDYGQTEDGSFYIAMELLVGTDLADVLQKTQVVELSRAVAITIQVCRALSSAHGKGIVHRDLKPENVFLVTSDDGREVVKIVDFGIAQMKDMTGQSVDSSRKLTRTGMIFGTPEYMSPEQAAGKSIDHRVDIYATGIILYEMFAGRVPFVGDTFMGVLTQHMFEQAPPIKSYRPATDVTPEIEAVIGRAIAKDPGQRYQSMQELTDDLVAVRDGGRVAALAGLPSSTAADGGRDVTPSPAMIGVREPDEKPRRTLLLAGIVAVLAVAVAGVGYYALTKNHGNGAGAGGTTLSAGNGGGTRTGNGAGGALPAGASDAGGAGPVTALQAGAGTDAGTTTAAGSADAGPELLTVHVTSTPVAARIEIEGQPGAGCDRTPCDVRLARGVEVRVRAVAANKRGEQTFRPDRDGAALAIAMRPTGGGTSGGTRPPNPGGGSRHRCAPGQSTFFNPATGLHEPCFLHQ